MSLAQIEHLVMLISVTGLVAFMGYIVWDLGKRSGAGRWGLFILLGVLMLAPAVFVLKELAVLLIDL
ncbi:MAG: DUF2788 domain-containing protein [Litorivicinaceae bacterium]